VRIEAIERLGGQRARRQSPVNWLTGKPPAPGAIEGIQVQGTRIGSNVLNPGTERPVCGAHPASRAQSEVTDPLAGAATRRLHRGLRVASPGPVGNRPGTAPLRCCCTGCCGLHRGFAAGGASARSGGTRPGRKGFHSPLRRAFQQQAWGDRGDVSSRGMVIEGNNPIR